VLPCCLQQVYCIDPADKDTVRNATAKQLLAIGFRNYSTSSRTPHASDVSEGEGEYDVAADTSRRRPPRTRTRTRTRNPKRVCDDMVEQSSKKQAVTPMTTMVISSPGPSHQRQSKPASNHSSSNSNRGRGRGHIVPCNESSSGGGIAASTLGRDRSGSSVGGLDGLGLQPVTQSFEADSFLDDLMG
jgi:hypothetical protein